MKTNKNVTIQILRVLAMAMIVIDHTIVNLNVPLKSLVSQITNSGVTIFVFLSAYLFGGKKIVNCKQWYIKRIKRIMVPFWIFMIFDFALEAIVWNSFDWKLIPVHMFGLQGIEGLGVTVGSIHLWYITLILILYLVTPLIQVISQKLGGKKIFIIVPLIVVQVVSSYTIDWGLFSRPLSWCIIALEVYLVGYWIGQNKFLDIISKNEFWISTAVVLVGVVLVFTWRKLVGENLTYDRIIQPYALVTVDLWICMFVALIAKCNIPKIVMSILDFFDNLSYEIYIVHGLVIAMGAVPALERFGIAAYLCVIAVGTIISSLVLKKISEIVIFEGKQGAVLKDVQR